MVLSIGIILDLIEEIKRYSNDLLTNNAITKVYKSQKFRNIKWKDIKVGNLIKIKNNEIIPADLLIICSHNPEGNFYLQTSNLDGETNLKEKEALNYTQKMFLNKTIKKDENNLKTIFQENCEIEVIKPSNDNKNIYEIDGTIYFKDKNQNKNEIISFDSKNCALRGARLKNTKFIYGIVMYTGKETKIMLNIIKYKVKFAYLDKLVDSIVFIIIIIRIIYVIIFTGIGIYYRKKYLPKYDGTKIEYDYLFYYRHNDGKNEINNFIENLKFFSSHFILSQTLLPTSVALLLAIIKVIQSLFIEYLEIPLRKNKDEKMKCFSNELLGELGSVKYIFSDKTGTLTKNQTQFKACSIYTSLFDDVNEEYEDNFLYEKSKNISNTFANNSIKLNSNKYNLISQTFSNISSTFNSQNLLYRLELKNTPLFIKDIEGCPFKSQGEALEEFVLNMALNHNVVVDDNNGDIKYHGANPDEITLVGTAKELGFAFLGKVRNILYLERKLLFEQNNKRDIKKFKLLKLFPFRSERQRSTIIVKDLQNNIIKLYSKGSDTKIFERINQYSKENILKITKNHVDNFARRGLRILCFSFKLIPENEYNEWLLNYNKIKENIKIEKEEKEKQLENAVEEIEKDCFLLGATALEDQLQDNIENDIKDFIQAGINFWMLTGDKMDTAESIGNSIKLLDADTEIFKINGTNEKDIIERMEEIKKRITEIKKELSNFNINDEYIKKEDINKKVNSLKEKIENKFNNIYQEQQEKKEKKENIINNNEFKEKSEVIELNKDNIILKEDSKANGSIEYDNNFITNSIKLRNMSILKFMIDEEYFINSNNINSSILKGKVVKPSIEYSNKSENFNYQENSKCIDINKNDNDNNSNLNNNDIHINVNSNINNENIANIIISNRRYNKEIIKKKEKKQDSKEIQNGNRNKRIVYKQESSVNEPLKNNNNSINNKDNIKKFMKLKENQRKRINLPTNALKFLEYFDIYLKKIKKYLYMQQQAFFLFKLPYLYNPPNNEVDTFKENMKKIDWKKKFIFKSYLLNAKIKYSLIINGKSINACISEGKASELFWFLIKNSRSVICSQCLPIQKSKIIEFVKKHTKDITLAIGDGENDVNMIKTAHIGIGIFGKEGCQAAFNSDYAFYQFKYLKRLLFFNGRFILLRNTYFLNMFFFKNFFYTLIPIIFAFFNLYSGTFFYDEFYDSMFNTFVSIIPLIVFSVIDEDIDLEFQKCDEKKKKWMLYLLPDLYKQTRDSKPFNLIKYIICAFISFIYAFEIFFFFSHMYIDMIMNSRGEIPSYYELIFNVYFSIIFIHFFMIYIDTSLFNYLVVIFLFLQILGDFLFIVIFNKIENDNKLSGIVGEIIHFDNSFLTVIINCAVCCLPFYILRRAELFFGLNYSNLIKLNKLEAIYLGNYYKKEVEKMIRATRAIAKFKRIHKEFKLDKKPNDKNDNLNDRKMRKLIERWEKEKNIKHKNC